MKIVWRLQNNLKCVFYLNILIQTCRTNRFSACLFFCNIHIFYYLIIDARVYSYFSNSALNLSVSFFNPLYINVVINMKKMKAPTTCQTPNPTSCLGDESPWKMYSLYFFFWHFGISHKALFKFIHSTVYDNWFKSYSSVNQSQDCPF